MLINKIKKEDGAIAIITIFFLATVGIVSVLALWSIGVSTGAYNKLYVANQSAVFSAVTTTLPEDGSDQPVFSCQDTTDLTYICQEGVTYQTFSQVFEKTLSGGSSFGIDYASSGSNRPTFDLQVFEIIKNPAEAKDSCLIERGGNPLTGGPKNTSDIVIVSSGEVVCWRVRERGIIFDDQYTSGVLSSARVTVPSIPGLNCGDNIFGFGCVNIKVLAAASSSQISQRDYNFYNIN
jgi:hypothetical protein